METRFILPATAAAVLHSFVLFGVTWPTVRPGGHQTPEMLPTARPMTVVEIPLDPPDDKEQSDTATSGGQPDTRPDLPEQPVESREPIFPIPRDPVSPTTAENLPKIPVGPFGDPKSTADGPSRPGPISIEGLDHTPKALSQVPPVYPYELKREGVEGEVLVAFIVDEEGCVTHPQVVRSSNSGFETNTLQAVAKWRFEPGKRYGRIVCFRMAVPVSFTLEK